EATFFVVKPVDMSKSTGLLWHFVPNRGGRLTLSTDRRADGDISLSSGWQGDNSGGTAHDNPGREFVKVPIATYPDGSPVTGKVMGRILNPEGPASSQMFVHSNPVPYKPVTLDTTQATLTVIESEAYDGTTGPSQEVKSEDWAWARCNNGVDGDFPGTPDPTQICVRGGFKPDRVYQVVFTAQDPYVLGMGFAAFRDVGSFFKHESEDDSGNLNPLGDHVSWILSRGSSQSGTFLRQFLHLGFNEDEAGRQVQDGTWPWVAGRRIGMNFRFAMPDGVMKIYEPGTEGALWWHRFPDHARGLPPRGILDRCLRTNTCPKVIEHFGAAEVWGQKLTAGWVGMDLRTDIPLPKNVRRYYIPSTDHGGGPGGFSVTPLPPGNCPSVGYGRGTFARNPLPHTETRNAIEFHFRNWVMHDILPPPSRWPRLRGVGGTPDLVEATKEAMGFPSIPGVPSTLPSDFINPFFDYDFGDDFIYTDTSGFQTVVPPVIKQVIPMLVPRVDADGNEVGGVPVVLHEAPLGTYLGWNIVAEGFHKGTVCGYEGGMIAFANTRDERLASGDPRLSLEERYGDHEGYVEAVRSAAANAVAEGFLLPDDAATLIAQAQASNVLNP
ncbi:MAG: alpha/beta hydrolase domain-containing protein, partial [Alphaproteobacteria bacterium]|nr:alpha/beta hydrolase domain-containing protein [Alphaproteobacteria bacterium]